MLDTLNWLRTPRTTTEFAAFLDIDLRTARNWIEGWCERGWIRPAHFERQHAGRPALTYITESVPKDIEDMLNWKYKPRDVERPDARAFSDSDHDYFRTPRTVLEYRLHSEVAWPTAKSYLSRWVEQGFLLDAGLLFGRRAPPAQLYCSDVDVARRGVLKSAATRFARWRRDFPGADIDTWEP